ncbi:MAG: hypothetical protein KGJ08_04290 [Gammaproteobacteria bacterium]|nr:hypothetical protein [Gammaproteobacteria bacterium]
MLAYPAFHRISAWLTGLSTTLASLWDWKSWPASSVAGDVDHNADMVDDMDEYVTVATFDKTTDAHIAIGRLAVEGIRAQLFDDNMVQMDWLYAIALGGIKLRVARSDEILARTILATDYSHDLDDMDVGKQEL